MILAVALVFFLQKFLDIFINSSPSIIGEHHDTRCYFDFEQYFHFEEYLIFLDGMISIQQLFLY